MTIEAQVGEARGELRAVEKDAVVLWLDAAFAPGRPLKVQIGDLSLDVKSLGSRRVGEGFVLRAQFRTVSKFSRQKLEALAKDLTQDVSE